MANDTTIASAAQRDAIGVEVFANLFKAIVDEMAWVVLRSSHTTFVKETQDFGVALVTPEGEMFAYPYGSGATVLMGVAMDSVTQGIAWEEGDVVITNDPYATRGMVMHLNDIYAFRPVFVDGELLCLAWTFIHCTDVGGYAPGSIDMQNSEGFQEGLRMRPGKLFKRGVLNEEVWNLFAANCRIPSLNWGNMNHHPFLAMSAVNYVVTKSEAIHINAGILRCIDLVLPEASVVNASFPAACGMRFTTAMRVHDLVLGALTKAIPGKVPVAGSGVPVVTYISTSELGGAGRVVVANPVSGGSGASGERDGISGAEMSVAFLRNVPVEVLEAEAPVVVRRFSLAPDSEGPGKFRGGFGVAYELEIKHPSAVVVMRGKERQRFCAWGAGGGLASTTSGNIGTRRNSEPHDIGKRTVYRAELGEVIRLWGGGGGGFGEPFERDPEMVAADVAAGLVSPERAREIYGVAVANGAVDAKATAALRGPQRDIGDDSLGGFDFGPARTEWERVHGLAAERIAAWLPGLPVAVRRYAQADVYRRLHETGPGPYKADAVVVALTEVGAALGAQTSAALQHAAQ